jgi:pyruvate dehydrogenase E1 component alpha subunit
MARDPIPMYHQRLLQLGVGEEVLTGIAQQVGAAVQTATEEATDGALPSLDAVFTDVWADGGWTWRN